VGNLIFTGPESGNIVPGVFTPVRNKGQQTSRAARDPARMERIKHRQRHVGSNAQWAKMKNSRLCFKKQKALCAL
jgi:hypothetical protein